jgi:hypothetical protein
MILEYDTWSRRFSFHSPLKIALRAISGPISTHSPWLMVATLLCVYDLIVRKQMRSLRDRYFLLLVLTVFIPPVLLSFASYAPPRYSAAIVPAHFLLIAYWFEKPRDFSLEPRERRSVAIISVLPIVGAVFLCTWTVVNVFAPYLPVDQGDEPGITFVSALRYLAWVSVVLGFVWFRLVRQGNVHLERAVRLAIPIVLILSVVGGARTTFSVWFSPNYGSSAVRDQLERTIPEGSVVIGDWAPFFCLGTDIPVFYATSGRNSGYAVLRLKPNYYLDSETPGDIETLASFAEHVTICDGGVILGQYAGRDIVLRQISYGGVLIDDVDADPPD